MEKRYQTMTFSINQYTWRKTADEAREEMWKDIGKFLQLLTKNNYIAVIYDDDTDIIVIQYEHNELHDAWGVSNPQWITEDEYLSIKMQDDDITSGEMCDAE